MDKIIKYILEVCENMDNKTVEVYLNCKEQELYDYFIEAYYEINMHEIELQNSCFASKASEEKN